jgi:hypothetical protein
MKERTEHMNTAVILGIVRHLLTGLGGAVVAQGWASEEMVTQGIGAIVTLAGLAWSIVDKKRAT